MVGALQRRVAAWPPLAVPASTPALPRHCAPAGLALLNNLAQLVKALSGGGSALEVTPVLVSLFSVANCGGRMALGFFPERLLHSRGTPRLLFLPAVSALMAGTCAALAYARLPHLYPLSALAGFSFGGWGAAAGGRARAV